MFKFFKKLFNDNYIFLIIFIFFLFIRLYRISELTTFGGDQGVDFITVREMVLYNKWTLIGIKTSIAPFFQGPLYLYLLFPFFYFMNLVSISGAYAAIVVSSASLIIFYVAVRRYFSKDVALLGSAIFTASPELVIYGNTPLYQNFLPIFIILAIYIFLSKKETLLKYILLGLILGLGMEMHFLNVSLVATFFIYFIFAEKTGIKRILGFVLGILIGLIPTIAFELRHNFLNIRLLLNYVSGGEKTAVSIDGFINQWLEGSARFLSANNITLGFLVLFFGLIYLISKKKTLPNIQKLNNLALILFFVLNIIGFVFSAFGPEYPLPFFILMLIVIPIAVFESFSKKVGLIVGLLLVFSNTFVSIRRLGRDSGYNMPPGLTLSKINLAGKIVSEDALFHQNFNIASILDGGTRAYPLRYTVLINGQNPGDVTKYPNNNYLYLLAGFDKSNIFESTVWEIQSMKPFKIGDEWNLNDNIYLYRLDKQT